MPSGFTQVVRAAGLMPSARATTALTALTTAAPVAQHLGVEQHVRPVEHAADRHAEQRLALRDQARDRREVVEAGVTRLQRADDRGVRTELVETRGGFGGRGRDRGEIAELHAAEHVAFAKLALVAEFAQPRDGRGVKLEPRMQADLHAGIGAVFRILHKIKARFAELLLRLEQLVELGAGGLGAHDDGGVVARGALRIVLEPVARLGGGHLLVIGGKKADGRRAAHPARKHRLGGPHEDVVGLDGAQAAAGGALHNMFNARQRMEQRLGAGRLATGGAQRRARRPDGRIVEDHPAALDRGQHQLMQCVGPALDRVGNDKGRDGGVGAKRGERREFGHMMALDGESHAAAAEQEVKRFAKRLQPVNIGEGAVVDAGVLVEDRLAAELQTAHRRQHFASFHRGEGGMNRPRAAGPAGRCA